MKATKISAILLLAVFSFPVAAETAAESAARDAAAVFAGACSAGDLGAVWSAMPDTWKTSVSGAAKAIGSKAKANPAVWSAVRDCLLETSATIAKKSGYTANLVSRSLFPPAAASVTSDGISPPFVRAAAKLGAMVKAATPGVLASGAVETLFDQNPLALPGITDALPQQVPVSSAAYSAKSLSDGSVSVSMPGVGSMKMVQSGGKWVPEALARIFAGSSSWKRDIESVSIDGSAGAGLVSALGMMRKTAASAGKASSQEQFDAIIKKMM